MGDQTMPDMAVRDRAILMLRLAGRNGVRVFLALSALFLLVVGLGPLTGAYRTVTVLSGSMGSGMPIGAIAVLAPVNPAAVKVGDVITFMAPIAGHPVVTHRVVEILEGGAHPVVRTKGDANQSADSWSARLDSSPAWRRVAVVPYAGSVIRALRSGPAHWVTIRLAPALLLAAMLLTIWSQGSKERGKRRRPTRQQVTVVGLAVGLATGVPAALATFQSTTTATGTYTAAPDWVAPSVNSTTIAKQTGYLAGSIKQGGTYFVYANVTDSGNLPSGVTTVTANVSAITTGLTAVALTLGSYSIHGMPYIYRTAALTANGSLSGTKSYTITSTDALSHFRTETGYTVTIDNAAPTASDIQTVNKTGGTQGKAELGDTITFAFSEQIDPRSILAAWTGPSTNVTVRLIDGGCALFVLCADDTFAIYNAANSSPLPLGTVNLNRSDYNGGTLLGSVPPLVFSNSTMVQAVGSAAITITLGTMGSGTAETTNQTATMVWAPNTAAYDAAGNAASAASANESGTDKDF